MSELRLEMNPQERAARAMEVDRINKQLFNGKTPVKDLGKDEFLTLLLTQLSHQDPTAPMEDREFISQMAQLNTLQQMTSMANDFNRLAELFTSSEAASSLGKSVELNQGDKVIQGTVKAVSRGGKPEVLVNGTYYQWDQVTKVFEE
ncbi:MAG: flagellar hook assembly protein FlgD [Spirochaetaceae bacterium]|jgi:flagellar basal-body rod modification protein FlgD|nr:flagellar hook assembly protein FlgD [Spirochaetaceae bacterium]